MRARLGITADAPRSSRKVVPFAFSFSGVKEGALPAGSAKALTPAKAGAPEHGSGSAQARGGETSATAAYEQSSPRLAQHAKALPLRHSGSPDCASQPGGAPGAQDDGRPRDPDRSGRARTRPSEQFENRARPPIASAPFLQDQLLLCPSLEPRVGRIARARIPAHSRFLSFSTGGARTACVMRPPPCR